MNGTKRDKSGLKLYTDLLKNPEAITPIEKEYTKHVCHLYVVRHKERKKLTIFGLFTESKHILSDSCSHAESIQNM
jgi:hypothetical protein